MILNLSEVARSAQAEALRKVIGRGAELRIYDGSVSQDTCLARLPIPAPTVDGPNLTIGPIKDGRSIASGIASWGGVVDANGISVFEFDVGETDATMLMNDTKIVAGGPVEIDSFTIVVAG